ncbi:MAG: thiamine ABC transporter substrate-binding protein [Candidatus Hodarchaeales archaeon]|jgi:thiamine transport system substrate-binding protein
MVRRIFFKNINGFIHVKRIIILFFSLNLLLIINSGSTTGMISSQSEVPHLTIYAYESLLNYGLNATDVNLKVFDAFEEQESCIIDLEYFSDAGATLAKVVAEKGAPIADIIIGIDNTMIYEAKRQNILEKYEPSTKNNLSSIAVQGLDPEFHVTPYDYGFISLIYHKNKVNSSLIPDPAEFTLSDLMNPSLAELLVTEDPTLSSTGLGFLMWTIGVYDKVLNENWLDWWKATKNDIQIEKSWGDAFDVFYQDVANRPIMVSYATDPAYNWLFFNDTSVGTLLSHENDFNYAWLQIEGVGIVKDSSQLLLAQKFIDWFTDVPIQELIPENNWMYPVNTNASLPESFIYAVDPSSVNPLNDYFTPLEISESLDDWLDDWEREIIIGGKISLPMWTVLLNSLVVLILLKKRFHY